MHPKWTPGAAWLIGLFGLLAEGPAHAGPPDHRDKNGVEVLTRGPVHEAYALPADQQTAPGPLVPRQPPADVEELPPDQKPDGADVQWLPGYWSWDDERRDFVWVSGFWRVPPPDRAWVPGGWRKGGSGWQWVSGFWNPVGDPARPEARIEFLPEPPAPIEAGPTIPAPANDSVYVPGTWVYRERYLWRSGYWADYRPGWVWAPACYRWTPSGHVFIDGYWDRSLEDRGVLFPPVAIAQEVYAAPGFAYTPAYAIRPDALYGALFVCRDRGSYYFGDYFGHDYAGAGFTPWCSGYVNVGFGAPRGFCDPLFSYYRAAHLSDSYWGGGGIGRLYADRYRGEGARPPRTLVQQNLVVNNLTNNTVINNTVINNATVVTPLRADRRMGDRTWAAVTPESRRQYAGDARQSREVGRQRQQLETQLAARGPQPSQATAGTRSGTISLPSRVVARGQAPAAQSKPDVPAGRPQATAIRSVDQRSPTQPAQPRVAAAPPAPRPTVAGRAAPSRVDPNSQAPRALSRPEANPSRINPRSSVVDQPKENRLSPSAPPRSPRPEFGRTQGQPPSQPRVEPKLQAAQPQPAGVPSRPRSVAPLAKPNPLPVTRSPTPPLPRIERPQGPAAAPRTNPTPPRLQPTPLASQPRVAPQPPAQPRPRPQATPSAAVARPTPARPSAPAPLPPAARPAPSRQAAPPPPRTNAPPANPAGKSPSSSKPKDKG